MVTPAEQEYQTAYDQNDKVDKKPDITTVYSKFVSPLGQKLEGLFTYAEGQRNLIEERWLKDLRQYRGEYDAEVISKLHPKRSKAFLSLTRSKTKTITSRMTDLLFPANGIKNWGIDPSPIPELSAEVQQSIAEQMMQQTGKEPTMDDLLKAIDDQANNLSDNMEKEMSDQLNELKYREIIRNCIHSGGMFGTGILKGPLAKEKVNQRWLPDGEGGWASVDVPIMLPYCEFVPVWDIYPDMSARKQDDMRYIFQRYAIIETSSMSWV